MAYSLYEPGSSFLHRADPAAKILTLCACFAVELLAAGPAALAGLALAVIVAPACAGMGGALIRFGKFAFVLFFTCALLWALFSRDPAAGGPLAGLARGLWVGLRLTTLLAMGLVFLASTRVEEMAAGLHRLGLPFVAAFSLTLALRLLPLFAGSGATIVQAQACRGVDVREGGPLRRLRRCLPLLAPLVLSSLRTADHLAVALESRGLGMGPRRTTSIEGRFRASDAAMVAGSMAAAAAAAWLRWGAPR